jgi:hypothetical protein
MTRLRLPLAVFSTPTTHQRLVAKLLKYVQKTPRARGARKYAGAASVETERFYVPSDRRTDRQTDSEGCAGRGGPAGRKCWAAGSCRGRCRRLLASGAHTEENRTYGQNGVLDAPVLSDQLLSPVPTLLSDGTHTHNHIKHHRPDTRTQLGYSTSWSQALLTFSLVNAPKSSVTEQVVARLDYVSHAYP